MRLLEESRKLLYAQRSNCLICIVYLWFVGFLSRDHALYILCLLGVMRYIWVMANVSRSWRPHLHQQPDSNMWFKCFSECRILVFKWFGFKQYSAVQFSVSFTFTWLVYWLQDCLKISLFLSFFKACLNALASFYPILWLAISKSKKHNRLWFNVLSVGEPEHGWWSLTRPHDQRWGRVWTGDLHHGGGSWICSRRWCPEGRPSWWSSKHDLKAVPCYIAIFLVIRK